MMRCLVPVLVLLLGCAPREIQGPRPCGPERCRETMTVAVAALEDQRRVEEIGAPQARPYPVAEAPETAMSTELARDLVAVLTTPEFFRSTTLVEGSGSPPSPQFLARLADRGYDAVITGNVPRCLGSTCVTGGDLAGFIALRLIGLINSLILPLPFGYYHNEGVVTVTDLRLTDTRSGEVLWRENFTRNVVHYSGDPSPGPAIHEAMHDLTHMILEDLARQLRSGRQGAPGREGP